MRALDAREQDSIRRACGKPRGQRDEVCRRAEVGGCGRRGLGRRKLGPENGFTSRPSAWPRFAGRLTVSGGLRTLPARSDCVATQPINQNWFLHIQSQFERARPILFTGAGFSLGAANVRGKPVPSSTELRKMLWELCFPGAPVEDGSSLQDLYDHALRRSRAKLAELPPI